MRRARQRVHVQLKQVEGRAERYYKKLAMIEAAMLALDPTVRLPPRFHGRNPHLAPGELSRALRAIVPTLNGPVTSQQIALMVLSRAGVQHPSDDAVNLTRKSVNRTFAKWRKMAKEATAALERASGPR